MVAPLPTRHRLQQLSPHHRALVLIYLVTLLPLATSSFLPSFSLSSRSRRAFLDSIEPTPDQPLIAGDYICKSLGECEACPESEMSTPLCRLYGNRRALSCTTSSSSPSSIQPLRNSHVSPPGAGPPPPPPSKEQGKNHASSPNSGSNDQVLHMPSEGSPDKEAKVNVESDPLGVDDESILDQLREGAARMPERRQAAHELRTWEACEKVVRKERADFFEFVLTNAFFAFASLIIFLFRHRTLASRQYGRLAARIGVTVTV